MRDRSTKFHETAGSNEYSLSFTVTFVHPDRRKKWETQV